MALREHIESTLCFAGSNGSSAWTDKVHIAMCADQNVIRAMGVFLYSIVQNIKKSCVFHLFFRGELSIDDKERIQHIIKTHNMHDIYIYI